MKIAVYTIALNEEKHVKQWFDSAKEADLLLIADTGSTDKTRFVAKSLGITVQEIEVTPWRFDVARNASLALIPEDFDICIQLDMDETLQEGWRPNVEKAFAEGNNWPIYKEVTRRNSDYSVAAFFHHSRVHPRKGFLWKYPIHEIIGPTPGTIFKREEIDLEVDHKKDLSKPRSSYLPLLQTAVLDDPNDWRMNHYLNREYLYNRDWNKVLSTAYEAMEINNGWDVERASTCMWASEAAHHLGLKKLAIEWARRATAEAPEFYEACHWRAHIAHLYANWEECREFAIKIESLSRQGHHLVKPEVWEWWGFDLIALSSHKLLMHEDAIKYGQLAINGERKNERLKKNFEFYFSALSNIQTRDDFDISIYQKLNGLPTIYYINLDISTDRLNLMRAQFEKFKILDSCRVTAKAANSSTPNEIACLLSHFDALDAFLKTGHDYGIIAEDDLNLSFAQNWNFNWTEKFSGYKKIDFDAIQLSLVTVNQIDFNPLFHNRLINIDWSCGAYLVSRVGAENILHKNHGRRNFSSGPESELFDNLKVFTEPIFTNDLSEISLIHQEHIDAFHKPSWTSLRNFFVSLQA